MEEIKIGDRVSTQVVNTKSQSFTHRLGRVADISKAKPTGDKTLVFYTVKFDDGDQCALTACSLMKIKEE
jgi:hypothetical protein